MTYLYFKVPAGLAPSRPLEIPGNYGLGPRALATANGALGRRAQGEMGSWPRVRVQRRVAGRWVPPNRDKRFNSG